MNMVCDYTLGPAIFDLAPVAPSFANACFLADRLDGVASFAGAAWLGAVGVALGGLPKATWKLIVVNTNADTKLLDNGLLVILRRRLFVLACRSSDRAAPEQPMVLAGFRQSRGRVLEHIPLSVVFGSGKPRLVQGVAVSNGDFDHCSAADSRHHCLHERHSRWRTSAAPGFGDRTCSGASRQHPGTDPITSAGRRIHKRSAARWIADRVSHVDQARLDSGCGRRNWRVR